MSFLTKPELKTKSTTEIIDLITGTDDETVNEIIEETIDLMISYLFQYYDTDAIFSATGTARKKVVVKFLKSIVIYELFLIRSKNITKGIEVPYNEAMKWLEGVAAGNMKPQLPPKKIDSDGDGIPDQDVPFMKLGSRKSYQNHY